MKICILILQVIILNLFSCDSGYPPPSENWSATRIFRFDGISIDQSINNIFLVNETTGFLLGDDRMKVKRAGGKTGDGSSLFFRSTDGGRTFEKQVLGKGILKYISRSSDGKTFYMIQGVFNRPDDRKPSHFRVWKSSDTGRSWEELYLFENKLLTKVLFYNDSIGFASVMQDRIGYDLPVLYRTDDGGKTWKPTGVDMDNKTMCLITSDGKLLGQYLEDIPAVWQTDVNGMNPEHIPLDIPQGLSINSLIQSDPLTGLHYCKLRTTPQDDESGKEIEYRLICLETGEIIRLPSPSYDFNVYGDFIGVRSALKDNEFVAQYRYSYNKGRYWETETPKNTLLSGMPGMYGKGCIWSMCSMEADGIYYPLLVRIPPEEN